MNDITLKAAAARLRSVRGDWRLFPYATAPDDCKLLAEAWLDEHLIDDSDTPSAEWLAAIGGKLQKFSGDYSFFGLDKKKFSMLWISVRKDEGFVTIALVDKDNTSKHIYLKNQNRGEIRSLFRSLGIPLNEAV